MIEAKTYKGVCVGGPRDGETVEVERPAFRVHKPGPWKTIADHIREPQGSVLAVYRYTSDQTWRYTESKVPIW